MRGVLPGRARAPDAMVEPRLAAEVAELADDMAAAMPLAKREWRSRPWWESSVIGGRFARAGTRDWGSGRVSVASVGLQRRRERRVRERVDGSVVCIFGVYELSL